MADEYSLFRFQEICAGDAFYAETNVENINATNYVEHHSPLASYFSNSDKNIPFFEAVPKSAFYEVTSDSVGETSALANAELSHALYSAQPGVSYTMPVLSTCALFDEENENLRVCIFKRCSSPSYRLTNARTLKIYCLKILKLCLL